MRKIIFIPLVALLTASIVSFCYASKNLYVVEIDPSTGPNYTIQYELQQVKDSASVAVQQIKKIYPCCDLAVHLIIHNGTQDQLYRTVHSISQKKGDNFVVGFYRSDFASIAAYAAQGSQLKGISTGASAFYGSKTNNRFISMAPSIDTEWKLLLKMMLLKNCTTENTLALINPFDSYSVGFDRVYRRSFTKNIPININVFNQYNPVQLNALLRNKKCVFIGTNIGDAESLISKLTDINWHGSVFGTDDWTMNLDEMRKLIGLYRSHSLHIYAPRAWSKTPKVYFLNQHQVKMSSLLAAYTHDAVLIAGDSLCGGVNYKGLRYPSDKYFINHYTELSSKNHLQSPLTIHNITDNSICRYLPLKIHFLKKRYKFVLVKKGKISGCLFPSLDKKSCIVAANVHVPFAVKETKGLAVFKTTGDYSFNTMSGLIANITNQLIHYSIPVNVSSAYNTDFYLISTSDVENAKYVLRAEGWNVD